MNLFLTLLFLLSGFAHASEYAGQEKRALKSLSLQDIQDLENGLGWGFVKPAELNGLPGPVHLLGLKTELKLSASQIEKIHKLNEHMNRKAKRVGSKYIEEERQVEPVLVNTNISDSALESAVHAAGQTLVELRLTHLKAHLRTSALLTEKQIKKYGELRGYSNNNLCENPPTGHNADMWKKHNNCR